MFSGKNGAGREVTSGVYLYRLTVGDVTEARKLTLLK